MDLLFKRYASPFLFIEGMMKSGRFSEFVEQFIHLYNEERKESTTWEYYLNKVENPEISYQDFVDMVDTNNKAVNMTEEDKESSLQIAMNILNNFNPNEGGEQ
jgi:hypothetical protein